MASSTSLNSLSSTWDFCSSVAGPTWPLFALALPRTKRTIPRPLPLHTGPVFFSR